MKVVLVGHAGAHLRLLQRLQREPLPDVDGRLGVTLVSTQTRWLNPRRLAQWVAGDVDLAPLEVPVAEAVGNTDAAQPARLHWLQHKVVALDAHAGHLRLSDGSELAFDVLSIHGAAGQDRRRVEAAIPGAREHGLFVRPLELFVGLWPQVLAMAATKNLRIAVIGAGQTGIELALAIAHRLPSCRVTLLTGGAAPGARLAAALQPIVLRALTRAGVTILQDRVTVIRADELGLQSGARLACDVPLLATTAHPPTWLAGSGLALDANGFVLVNGAGQSSRHANIFASGEISRHDTDTQGAVPASDAHIANRLAQILTIAARGEALQPAPQRATSDSGGAPTFITLGSHNAAVDWGRVVMRGRTVAWVKQVLGY